MKRVKNWLLIFSICFVFLNCYQLVAQNNAANNKQKIIEEKLDALNSNLKIIINQDIDYKLTKKIEEVGEEIYENRHKWSDKILLNGQWLVTVIIGLIALISIGMTFLSYRWVKEKANEEIKSIHEASQMALKSLEDQIDKVVTKETKEARAKIYYDIAVSVIADKKFDIALNFLETLYISNYRLRNVCFHMGTCYKHLNNLQQSLKFFEEARINAEEEGRDILVNTIQKEIDEVRGKLKDSE